MSKRAGYVELLVMAALALMAALASVGGIAALSLKASQSRSNDVAGGQHDRATYPG